LGSLLIIIFTLEFQTKLFAIKNTILPKKGTILISEPLSQDLYFRRSVVLLVEHSEEGSMGFILNKKVSINLKEFVADFPDFDAQFNLGGPVATNTIFFIHTLGEIIPGAIKIKENLFWGGDFEFLKFMILQKQVQTHQIRFFIGYSGWSGNQLYDEMKGNSWLVSKASIDFIMEKPIGLWKKAVTCTQYKNWTNIPEDPTSN